MSRLIDADALKKIFKLWDSMPLYNYNEFERHIIRAAIIEVESAPTIDAEPVRHGKWIDENCSICGQYVYHGDARNFCPACGARMEVSE